MPSEDQPGPPGPAQPHTTIPDQPHPNTKPTHPANAFKLATQVNKEA